MCAVLLVCIMYQFENSVIEHWHTKDTGEGNDSPWKPSTSALIYKHHS